MKFKKLSARYRVPLIAVMLGIALMLVCTVLESRTESKTQGKNDTGNNSDNITLSIQNEFERYASYEERRLERILSEIEGVGEVSAAVYVGGTPEGDSKGMVFPEIKGVLIYAEGGNRASVKEKIMRAVAALYDLPLSKISVLS